jgi:antitoxin component of MazEF toxin-antitoxin module
MKLRTKSVGLPVKNMPPSTSDDTTVSTSFTTTLEQYDNDLFLTIPEDILKKLGWNTGDELNWSVNKGSITLEKAMTEPEKWNRGLDIFIESVIEPDPNLRAHAHEQECFHELMWVRENVLEYLKTLRWKE